MAIAGHASFYATNAEESPQPFLPGTGDIYKNDTHCDFLRELFGNPFRPIHLGHSWLSPQVVALAKAAYEERDLPFGKLDITWLFALADALEAAGCHDAEILGHCRGPGPHVRGCWVVDLLLGKS